MLKIARWTQPDFINVAKATKTCQLISIDFSHYVEFSRWCMQYKQKTFVEHGYAPGGHILPALSVRVCGAQAHLSESSRMVPVEADNGPSKLSDRARKKKGVTAVPILVASDGSVLRDSWEIAEFVGFQPVDPTLKRILDEELGPLSRQLFYAHSLKEKNAEITNKLFLLGTGLLWKSLWYLGLGKYLKKNIADTLRVHDTTAVRECRAKLDHTFSTLGSMLKNKSTLYLGGDKPGAADFALAALASPIVNAHDYNFGKYDSLFAEIEQNDKEYMEEIAHWRGTDVGKHCLMMYEKFRREVEK